jgi:tRNA-(ms[2]io[6]A)-hydroxylase
MGFTTPLRYNTPQAWIDCVIANMDSFLLDHAAAEKKASGMAVSMISHYPDRSELVSVMADLAIEELNHYKEVIKIIYARGLQLAADEKDEYVLQLRQCIRKGTEEYFLDRLLVASIIEARGAERFGLIAKDLSDEPLKAFYQAIATSEQRHYEVFLHLAKRYFAEDIVDKRFDDLLNKEAAIVAALPIQAKLH